MESGENQEMKHFVTFEGIDGSGKSTISKLVFKQLKSQGHDVVLTYEPTDTWIGKRVQFRNGLTKVKLFYVIVMLNPLMLIKVHKCRTLQIIQ